MDHMGQDLSVVNAARVSFDKESLEMTERDEKLINYLAKHNHWTPFGQCNLQLRIKMPIFVARQMMRSNVGIVWNEVSRRYVDSEPEFYEPDVWRGRPEGSIKQGSGEPLEHLCSKSWCRSESLNPETGEYEQNYGFAYEEPSEWYGWQVTHWKQAYEEMKFAGVCPEQARMVLPQSTYTEVVANFTLAALARVYSQRIDSHAQWEIQQYAKAMGELASQLFPVSWKALTSNDNS